MVVGVTGTPWRTAQKIVAWQFNLCTDSVIVPGLKMVENTAQGTTLPVWSVKHTVMVSFLRGNNIFILNTSVKVVPLIHKISYIFLLFF